MYITQNNKKINQINKENQELFKSSTSPLKVDFCSIINKDKKQEEKILRKKSNKSFFNKVKTSILVSNPRRGSIYKKPYNISYQNNTQNLNCLGSNINSAFQFLQLNLLNKLKEMQNNKDYLNESEGDTHIMISESINKKKLSSLLNKENNLSELEKNTEANKNIGKESDVTQKLNSNINNESENNSQRTANKKRRNTKCRGSVFIRKEYRILEHKNLVYDSMCDETTDDDFFYDDDNVYISPNNTLLYIFDITVLIISIYNFIYWRSSKSLGLSSTTINSRLE